MRGPIGLLATLAIAFVLCTYLLGLSGVTFWVFLVGIVMLVKGYTGWADSLPVPGKKTAKYAGIVIIVATVFMYGWFGLPALIPITWEGMGASLTGATVYTPIPSAPVLTSQESAACSAGVTPEERAQTVTATVNAYDQEAATGYGTAVDLTTNCFYYKNGNTGSNFVALSSDTADGSVTTVWSPGDTIYVYCGGSSYYTEPVEGLCVSDRTVPIVLKTHAACAFSNLEATAFDKNMNALTAAGNTTTADYDLTLGAAATEKVYIEWTTNVAVKSYNAYAVATAVTNDIKSVLPSSGQGFTRQVSPDHLTNLAVEDDSAKGIANKTVTFSTWTLPAPVLMKQWQSVKYGFEVTSLGDPSATDNVFITIDAAIICLLDGQYGKDPSTGAIYFDFFTRSNVGSQSDIGVVNLVTSPVGKDDCVVLEGN